MAKKSNNHAELHEKLRAAIDTEQVIAQCSRHLAGLIKNGAVRNKFMQLTQEALANKEVLLSIGCSLGARELEVAERCKLCKIDPESFSQLGAVILGFELTRSAVTLYHDLAAGTSNEQDKKIFERLCKEKKAHQRFLAKEQKFITERAQGISLGCFGDYCIPQVIQNL
ncbi:MAG: hypothetical protein ABH865_08200 [Candidatus Omnitrophota bacterium]|nr:hypothetical protein [Candidatus Omnitrophota bacterium]